MWPPYANDTYGVYWDNIALKTEGNVSYFVLYQTNLYWEESSSGSRLGWTHNLRLIKDWEE